MIRATQTSVSMTSAMREAFFARLYVRGGAIAMDRAAPDEVSVLGTSARSKPLRQPC